MDRNIGSQCHQLGARQKGRGAFTLIELLVVVAITSVLMAVFVPALAKARRRARSMLGASNQKEIVRALNLYAIDNDNRYPESVATIGSATNWNWQGPFVLTNIGSRAPHLHRAMSEYLGEYIEDADIMVCPNAPKKYKHLQRAWDAGDHWDNPDSPLPGPWADWVKGSYCFYWNYTGLLEDRLFEGPRKLLGGRRQSALLVSCYFGYDHWRSPGAFGSCEKFAAARIIPEETASSAYWSQLKTDTFHLYTINVNLRAGYADGHVDNFAGSEVVTMKVIKERFANEPYDYGPGDFYLPISALH